MNTWNHRNGIINNMILVRLLLVVGRTNIQNNSHAERFWKSFHFVCFKFIRLRVPSATTKERTTKRHLIDWNKRNIWYSVFVYAGILSIQKWPDHQLIASIVVVRACARNIKPFQFLINCFSVLPHYFVCVCVFVSVCTTTHKINCDGECECACNSL